MFLGVGKLHLLYFSFCRGMGELSEGGYLSVLFLFLFEFCRPWRIARNCVFVFRLEIPDVVW